MKVVVVTGGIGSGKSAVCAIMNRIAEVPVYEADARVKSLYEESEELVPAIERRLGCELRDAGGRFIKERLAKLVFSDPEALLKVEAEVFPELEADFIRFMESYEGKAPFVVFESATILEKPYFDSFGDVCILVDAPLEVRERRAAGRDRVPESVVKAKMNCQPLMNAVSQGAELPRRVDYKIMNDAGTEELENRTREALSVLGLLNDK